ncbi:dihydroxy-acid dehydratase [Actinoplanes sp. CA-051413]|uniref:dihydroxy-acid dehydratase domain-containing protein n=1 Tax=Actinoplanes sp. CA-051413 TaxID=3239899 RepID=UPI003D960BAA
MPLLGNLLEQGVRDMVRICDGRMSGTAYGTVVLHGAPEAAAGGRLGKARTGDMRDALNRHLDVDVSAAEREACELALEAVTAYSAHRRGWERVHVEHRRAGQHWRRARRSARLKRRPCVPRVRLTDKDSS